MAGLCWMAVMLGVLLSAGSSSAVVDQNQLAGIVTEVLNRYRPSYMGSNNRRRQPMFSLAVSIPYNNERQMYDMSQVTDPADQVRETILRCEVYTGTRVVAATVLRWPNVQDQCPDQRVQWPRFLRNCPQGTVTWGDVMRNCPEAIPNNPADHAEYRTLQRFGTLTANLNRNDLLLFFVISSPCTTKCTNEKNRFNILNSINEIKRWNNYVVAFSDVFIPRSGDAIPDTQLKGSLERLGNYEGTLGPIGLSNIYRCNGRPVECTSCSIDREVNPYCYSEKKPGPSTNLPSTRRGSPSPSGQGDRDRNDINTSAGGSANVEGSTGGVEGQGGKKRRRRRNRGKKGKKTNEGGLEGDNTGGMVGQGGSEEGQMTNEGGGVSSSQSGLNADVDNNEGRGRGGLPKKAKKVGGRRVAQKQGGGNKQKSKPKQKQKKTQNKGKRQGNQEVQGKARKPQNKSNQAQKRGGDTTRINQPKRKKGGFE